MSEPQEKVQDKCEGKCNSNDCEQAVVVQVDKSNHFRMRQPFKILVDIWGVITSFRFQKELFSYLDEHMYEYLMANYDTAKLQAFIEELVIKTKEDRVKYVDMPLIDDCSDIKEVKVKAIVDNLQYRRRVKETNVDYDFSDIWLDGYRKKTLRPHVFPDVLPNFKRWQSDPYFIKIYSFATGSIENQNLFLSASVEGDITKYLTCSFDAHGQYKYDSSKFNSIRNVLSEYHAANLFYLTDSPNKGKEAAKAGLTVFIVRREGNRKYKEEDLRLFKNITTLDQLDFVPFLNPNCC